jgi:hypothetical protein
MVLSALNETVSPDFVLNFTLMGLVTVLTATKRMFSLATGLCYHYGLQAERLLDGRVPAQYEGYELYDGTRAA